MDDVAGLSRKQVVALAEAHIRLFEQQLGAPNAVRSECMNYLRIWRSALAAPDGPLSKEALGEIQDALDCGDYAEMLEKIQ